jgi:hypothetical protein
MTKFKLCNVLISLIDTNSLNLKITEWIERTSEHLDKKHFWWSRWSKSLMI